MSALRDATEERLADDRRTCAQCTELTPGGYCRAAARGELQHAARDLRPDAERLHRCPGYRPSAEDADQRPGAKRWLDQPRLRGHAA
jgi:hypothetical protein